MSAESAPRTSMISGLSTGNLVTTDMGRDFGFMDLFFAVAKKSTTRTEQLQTQ